MALMMPRMPLQAACDNKENCCVAAEAAASKACGAADPLAQSATCAAAADPLARSGSTPAKGKVSALARMFAARLQAADAAPTAAARGNNAERVAAIRRRFAAVAKSQTTAVALRLPGAPAVPAAQRRMRDCDTAPLCISVVQPRVDDAARLRAEVEQLQSQLITHVAEVSLLRALLSEATAAPAAAMDLPSEAAVDHEDISALASRIADAERAEGELDAAADEIAALEEALEAAEQDAEEAAAAVDAAAARAQELQCELTSVRGAADADAARAQEQEASLQAALQEALRRAEAAESLAESRASELNGEHAAAESAKAAAEAGAAENAALCKALCEARAEAAAHEARSTAAEQRADAAEAVTAAAKADAVAAQTRAAAAETAARAAEQDAARVCDEAAATKAAAVAEIDAAESAKAVAAVMRDALALAAKDVFAARTVAAQLRRRNTKREVRRAELADSMTALMHKVANLGSALSSQPTAEVRQPAELLRISAQVKLLALDAELTGHSSGSVAGCDADAGEAETSSQLRPSSAVETDLASLQLRLWELTAENERLHGALAAALPVEQCKAIRAGGTSTPMRQDKEALEEQLAVLLADRTAVNASFAAAKREVAHLKQRVSLLEGEHDAALAAADDYAATATRLAARVGQLEAALGAVHAAVGGNEELQLDDGEEACTTPTALRKRGAAVLAAGLAEESECFSDAECSSPSAADLADDNLVRMRRAEALLARAAATPSVSFSLDCGFESAAESDTPCALPAVDDNTTPPLRRCRGVALLARAEAPSTCRSARKSELTDDEITDCETSEQLRGDFSPCPGSACSIMSRRVE